MPTLPLAPLRAVLAPCATSGALIALLAGCSSTVTGAGDGGSRCAPSGDAGAPTPVAVVAGADFSCLLADGGSVYCWGDDTHGQLGGGATGEAPLASPRVVQVVPSGVVQLSAGYEHVCARTGTGEVYCWGDDTFGQLGNGKTSSAEATPVKANILGVALDVAAGGNGTCVALQSGEVQCWGQDWWRILGRSSTNGPEPNPTLIPGVTGAVQVDTGGSHACAITDSGAVWCWGDNWWGQVGQSPVSWGLPPAAVPGVTATDVVLGTNHTCAVTKGGSGAIVCWGKNVEGELGGGSTEDDSGKPLPVASPPKPPFAAISAAGDDTSLAQKGSTCAIGDDGSGSTALYCWGANNDGRLGDGETSGAQRTPVRIALPASPPTAVDAGPKHGCAIAGGAVYCWGRNDRGQLGNGRTTDSAVPVTVCPP